MEASNPTARKTNACPTPSTFQTCQFRRQSDGAGVQSLFANPLRILALLACASLAAGCGSQSTDVADAQRPGPETQINAESDQVQPAEVVSQLLDRVRRGGQEASSNELLTKLAQQELTRIGRPFQFPGSPDTRFEVRQAFPVPDQDDAVWVHTFLTEPIDSGENFQYEVVWTLRKEIAGWRVSGFVIDQGEGMEPLEFDFENGDEMEARLAALEQAEGPVNR
ncbi:hypothetical protein TBK1r_36310 [Stieleria magnilauensis]|uniref:DUF4864 domain-containing protein n=1 Tax=Stieleria magnilauensis TaxID=2527963 RepID=A0ABX5XRZ2_9BACT|nr:hypothetical protein TBK1r_36310 [Planctomycetes bacterium TBK1r]